MTTFFNADPIASEASLTQTRIALSFASSEICLSVRLATILAWIVFLGSAVVVPVEALAQQTQFPPCRCVLVMGEGNASITPDYAQIETGVSTKAKTVKEATDANSKSMAPITKALLDSGIVQSDIQTSRFSVQPVYAPQEPRAESRLAGYSVSNRVRVKIRQIDQVGAVFDRLITAGATDLGNVEFLVSNPSPALDQAREAAVADARRKAEVYARALGIQLGPVEWISEESGFVPFVAMRSAGASGATAASVPISSGEDTWRVRITVAYELAR